LSTGRVAKGFAGMGKKKSKVEAEAFVLDCSVAVAWFFEDEANAYAESVEDALATAAPVVPALWHLEVANVLLSGERRGRTTEAKSTEFLALLETLPITVDDQTSARAWSDVLHLVRAHNLSAYDAAYLELALRRGLPLAPLDEQLKTAAEAVGVPEYRP
jgi:predicted nucleic acid-binding protein